MQYYTHSVMENRAEALSKLPALENEETKENRATGTENLTANLTEMDSQIRSNAEQSGTTVLKSKNPQKALECQSEGSKMVRPRGFEPRTCGSVDRRSVQLSYRRAVFTSNATPLRVSYMPVFVKSKALSDQRGQFRYPAIIYPPQVNGGKECEGTMRKADQVPLVP